MEFVAAAVTSALGVLFFWAATARDPESHRTALRVGLLVHVVSPQLLWWQMTSWLDHPEGDQLSFFAHGQELLDAVWSDPRYYAPRVVGLLTSTSSTEVMVGLAVVLLGVFTYPTTAIVVVSFFAYLGQLSLYRALRDRLPSQHGLTAAAACLLVPSLDFWTSGLVKEGVAIGGLGLTASGAARLATGRRPSGVALLLLGAGVVAQTKAYILFPLAASLAVWWFWDRQSSSQRAAVLARPGRIIVIAGAAAVGVYLLSSAFPRFSPEQFAMEASRQRSYAMGGSAFTLGSASSAGGEGLVGEAALAPLGAFNALFRPFLFEARNALMVPAALESTVLLMLLVRALVGPGLSIVRARTLDSPTLLASFVFVLMFAPAVGLTTLNFGTLSRYRVPMLPFLVLWLLVVGKDVSRKATASVVARATNHRGRS